MILLIGDTAGTVLPEGLGFLKPGWWLLHVLAVVFVYSYGYRKGRGDERRARYARQLEGRPGAAAPPGRARD
jgi:hypothetical protein